jgi:hypothetical protein
MEVQALRLVISDRDLDALVRHHATKNAPVTDLSLAILPDAVQVAGKYPTRILKVPFEMSWVPTVEGSLIRMTLDEVRVVGLPGNMLRGGVLDAIRKAGANVVGVTVEGESVVLNLGLLLDSRGIELRASRLSIRCEAGRMTIEV